MSLHLIIDGRDACTVSISNFRHAYAIRALYRARARLAIFRK